MQSRKLHPTHDGFTLAELLVVIAIIGIMFMIALPSLTNLAGQSKLDGAANAVHSAAKMARQHALANNQPTYLVFNEGQTDSNLAYRAYAVFTIDTRSPPVTQTDGYFLTDWTILPEGIVFDNEASDGSSNVFIPGAQSWDGGFNRDRQLLIQPDNYTVLGFKPRGTQAQGYKNDIHLTEGFYDATGNLTQTSRQGMRIRVGSDGDSQITALVYDDSGEFSELDI